MRARFTVVTSVHPLAAPGWFHVRVYDDVDELRAACQAHSPAPDAYAGTRGAFQATAFTVHTTDDGIVDVPAGRYAGVMRLMWDATGEEVAHEAVHAAAALVGRQSYVRLDFADDDSMPREETFAYTVGQVTAQVAAALHDLGAWTGEITAAT